jgi:hypothetical protein
MIELTHENINDLTPKQLKDTLPHLSYLSEEDIYKALDPVTGTYTRDALLFLHLLRQSNPESRFMSNCNMMEKTLLNFSIGKLTVRSVEIHFENYQTPESKLIDEYRLANWLLKAKAVYTIRREKEICVTLYNPSLYSRKTAK